MLLKATVIEGNVVVTASAIAPISGVRAVTCAIDIIEHLEMRVGNLNLG